MIKLILPLMLIAVGLAAVPGSAQNPTVTMKTTAGTMVVELYADKAPITVENFLAYVDAGFYDDTIFHRVIPGFMIQGGGFTAEMNQKEVRAPIRNEADNGVSNSRGTISMARTNDPHSATAQFFINSVDNTGLDQPSDGGWGYAVFGRVIEGLEVVDAISAVKTTTRSGMQNVPVEAVVLESATVVDGGS